MKHSVMTILLFSQVPLSFSNPLSRQPKGKEVSSRSSFPEPEEVDLQIQRLFLEKKINILELETLLFDSFLGENKLSQKHQRFRKRKIRRQSHKFDGVSNDFLLGSNKRQFRRRGNKGDLVPFPRVG